MRLYVAASVQTLAPYWPNDNLGRLLVPKYHVKGFADMLDLGIPWIADNGAYRMFEESAWRTMISRLTPQHCDFVVAPDKVGDPATTADQFEKFEPMLHELGFPVAYVTQDRCEPEFFPWDRIDAVFIGGSDAHKDSSEARRAIEIAHGLGKHVHMGRVNRSRRMRLAAAMGCDSVDGSMYSQWPSVHLRNGLQMSAAPPNGRLV